MVFNAVENSAASPAQTLTITDTGTAPLTLGPTAFSIGNDPAHATQDAARFTLVNAAAAPATLPAGASFSLQITYGSIAVTTDSAILDVTTNDPATPVDHVALHGIGTKGLGGTNQPSLATILQAYDIPTYVGEGPDDADAAEDSTYPNPPDPTSQEVDLQRLVKAGSGPVTIDVLASFVASGFPKSYVLGTYTPGDPTSLNQLFYDTAAENQTTYVQPQGSTSFDPGSSPFGFYFVTNVQVAGRIGYSEDALNTWDTTDPRKIRFFPMETPTGTVVPNTYILTSTEWDAPVGYDFTNMVAIVSNVKAAAAAPAGPVIGLQNLNAVPGSSTMVFNRIQVPNATLGDVVHDTGTLQVNNTGTQPLVISSYTLGSQWTLVDPPAFPATVAAGGSLDLSIRFIATTEPAVPYNETNGTGVPAGGGVYDGSLVLHSNDPDTPTATVPLAGWYQDDSENQSEPSLQTITNLLFGWGTDINSKPIPDLNETVATGSTPTYYGQETVSPYWAQADTGTGVSIQEIAAYHTQGQAATTSWFAFNGSSAGTPTALFTDGTDDQQMLFPDATGTTTAAAATFSPAGEFGFQVETESTVDSANNVSGGGGHHIRFYPLRTASGTLIPNTYLMGVDYGAEGENFDFQDDLYIVSNIRPATVVGGITSPQTTGAPAAPTDINATSAGNVNTVQWAPVPDSNLTGYDVYRSASASGPLALLTASPITATGFTDTSAPAAGTSYYLVTAIDSTMADPSLAAGASVANTAATTTVTGAPVAAAESVTTRPATAVTVNVFAAATDDSSATLIASSVAVTTAPADGTAVVDPADGAITYTPDAGFTGTDTLDYTVGDSSGATSTPATITVTVSATAVVVGSPVAANLSEALSADTPLTFDVAGSATDGTATIVPASVVITTPPAHGTASVNTSTGDITFTPASGFVGTDALQYTVADSQGAVSPPATVSLNIGATIGGTAGRALVFTDSAGSVVTVTPGGPGTAEVFFTGGGTETSSGPKGRKTVTISGSPSGIANVILTGTTAASSLVVTRRGASAVPVGGISVAGSIGRITAATSAFAGTLSVTGSAAAIQFASISGATMTIGPAASKAGLDFTAGLVTGSDLTSEMPVRSLKVSGWTGAVTAPAIASLTSAGAFSADVTVAGALSTTHITGPIAGTWSAGGAVSSLTVGSVASGWTGAFGGTVNSFTDRSGGFAGNLAAASINTLSITGADTGSITAGAIKSARIAGDLSGGAITLTNGVSRASTLGRLTVTGATTASRITSAGNIGAISTAGIAGSSIDAGTVSGVTLPGTAADLAASAAIGSVTVTGRAATFSDTDIGAQTIGSLGLGTVVTGNGGVPFGVGAGTVGSVSGVFETGGRFRLNRATLLTPAGIAAYFATQKLTPADFSIVPGI